MQYVKNIKYLFMGNIGGFLGSKINLPLIVSTQTGPKVLSFPSIVSWTDATETFLKCCFVVQNDEAGVRPGTCRELLS